LEFVLAAVSGNPACETPRNSAKATVTEANSQIVKELVKLGRMFIASLDSFVRLSTTPTTASATTAAAPTTETCSATEAVVSSTATSTRGAPTKSTAAKGVTA